MRARAQRSGVRFLVVNQNLLKTDTFNRTHLFEPEFEDKDFKKSSFSFAFRPNCVAVARNVKGYIAVRDTNDPTKTTLVFKKEEWSAFIKGVKNNEFDV